ncbi:MAG TPA: hypothetical protein VD767_11435, partial [Thermomicrobiales bacterium]|nr:hypothetical protein [Thermomicrobiales bacterium]
MNNLDRRSAATTRNSTPKGEVSGVLETLAAGLSMVIARPYLFILPLLVDLWAWLGVQVRADALIVAMQDLLRDQGGSNGDTIASELDNVVESLRINDLVASLTPSIFGGLPLDSLLNLVFTFLAPAMTVGIDRADMYGAWAGGLGRTVNPEAWGGVIGIAALCLLVASVMLALFKVPIAQAVRGGRFSFGGFLRDVVLGWVRILALGSIVLTLMVAIGLPILIVAQILMFAGINLVAVISLVLIIGLAMGALYTYFLLDAMFIYRVGPIRSAKMSYAVARANLGPTWRFAAASILVATGLLQVWDVLVQNPPGVVIALVLNAVIGTSLSIASMMFFHDRARMPRPIMPG